MTDVRITHPDGSVSTAKLCFVSPGYVGDVREAKQITPEAMSELDDFARWLHLPKPRPEFRAWRKSLNAVDR